MFLIPNELLDRLKGRTNNNGPDSQNCTDHAIRLAAVLVGHDPDL